MQNRWAQMTGMLRVEDRNIHLEELKGVPFRHQVDREVQSQGMGISQDRNTHQQAMMELVY
jgi:hypothetical protein